MMMKISNDDCVYNYASDDDDGDDNDDVDDR